MDGLNARASGTEQKLIAKDLVPNTVGDNEAYAIVRIHCEEVQFFVLIEKCGPLIIFPASTRPAFTHRFLLICREGRGEGD
jgi:hypothetical protein